MESKNATGEHLRLGDLEIRKFPNVIYIKEGGEIVALTPEEWARIVEFVGISGLAPDHPDKKR